MTWGKLFVVMMYIDSVFSLELKLDSSHGTALGDGRGHALTFLSLLFVDPLPSACLFCYKAFFLLTHSFY